MDNKSRWTTLLQSAITQPGLISKAYSAFHNYSTGNQLAAMVQCSTRGIEPSPINTYHGWQNLKRQVKKGEKAIELCMPLTRSKENDSGEKEHFISAFVWKPRWFVLSQTEGEPIEPPEIPTWSKELALSNLQILEIAFDHLSGNVQGYAKKRSIAVSPLAQLPHKTTFHELAHVVLGHTLESDFQDDERRAICEKSKPKALHCFCANRSTCPEQNLAEATFSIGSKATPFPKNQRNEFSAPLTRY